MQIEIPLNHEFNHSKYSRSPNFKPEKFHVILKKCNKKGKKPGRNYGHKIGSKHYKWDRAK